MKTLTKPWFKLTALSGIFLAALIFLAHELWAQTAPVLGIATTGTNQVTVTITNGVTNGVYEIYFVEFLNDTNWQLIASGSVGKTNFVFASDQTFAGFFRGLNGNDFDGDGVPNWQDARPHDPTIGLMIVTIEKPANGSNVQ